MVGGLPWGGLEHRADGRLRSNEGHSGASCRLGGGRLMDNNVRTFADSPLSSRQCQPVRACGPDWTDPGAEDRRSAAVAPGRQPRGRAPPVGRRGCLDSLYGAFCQGVLAGRRFFSSSVSLFDQKARFFVRPVLRSRRHAQELSRLAVAPSLGHAPPLPGHTLTAPSVTARLVRSDDDDQRGARFVGADQSRHNLVFGGSKDPNHDAVMRIGGEAPRRRTHSLLRRDQPWSPSGHRHLEPSSATRHNRDGGPKLSGAFSKPLIALRAERRRLALRPLARAATRRLEACAPKPRS
jgi:hypothetical protein